MSITTSTSPKALRMSMAWPAPSLTAMPFACDVGPFQLTALMIGCGSPDGQTARFDG
jgi:hypothetical protein